MIGFVYGPRSVVSDEDLQSYVQKIYERISSLNFKIDDIISAEKLNACDFPAHKLLECPVNTLPNYSLFHLFVSLAMAGNNEYLAKVLTWVEDAISKETLLTALPNRPNINLLSALWILSKMHNDPRYIESFSEHYVDPIKYLNDTVANLQNTNRLLEQAIINKFSLNKSGPILLLSMKQGTSPSSAVAKPKPKAKTCTKPNAKSKLTTAPNKNSNTLSKTPKKVNNQKKCSPK